MTIKKNRKVLALARTPERESWIRRRDAVEIVRGELRLRDVGRITFLPEGYSEDRKYILWQGEKTIYLLRMTHLDRFDRCEEDFRLMKKLARLGVPCSKPIAFGALEDRNICYTVLRYIEGKNGEVALPKLSPRRQYAIGKQAGIVHHAIHEIRCPHKDFNYPNHRKRKFERQWKNAIDSGVEMYRADEMERYVRSRLHLLDTSPVRLQHDDYHPGNLIVWNGHFAGVIDFNRRDWGDPVEDFIKIPMFTRPLSPDFARGHIDGYLSRGRPRRFWERYNLFVGMVMHASLRWTKRVTPDDYDAWAAHARNVIDTHDWKNGGPPR